MAPDHARLVRVGAVAALAYALCDTLHELAHLGATFLPLGVTAVSISTIGVSTTGSSAAVAAAGPVANLALGASLALVSRSTLAPSWRYFFWLFGSINLFNASAYLLYSAVLASGDWAVVFATLADAAVWRPLAALGGLVSYGVCLYAAHRVLKLLVASQVIAGANVEMCCTVSYWVGGLLLTFGAVFNPVSWTLVFSSGVATGFGAMVGLLLLPALVRRGRRDPLPAERSLQIASPWVAAGIVATALFVCVLGPGLRLAPAP